MTRLLFCFINPFWWMNWIEDVRELGWDEARVLWHEDAMWRRIRAYRKKTGSP